jgi:DNA polymerase/3'-5' exonuclease PolX
MLCKEAYHQGKKLHTDGSGLFKIVTQGYEDPDPEERRIASVTEESIFEALGMKYKKPEERE